MAKKETKEVITILSVRNKRKCIAIAWMAGADKVVREFHDNPLPSFLRAIDALNPHVATLCELPSSEAKKISATGITVSPDGDNSLALIVARKAIKKGKRIMNIATPLLPMYGDDENKALDHMDKHEAAAVEKVINEALKYLAGERAQGQIQFKEETPLKEDKGEGTSPLPGIGEDGPPVDTEA